MDLAVTQALAGLLTGRQGELPSELLELANALLAQSRSQASSLKADEEIARSYVCAHLACNRLKRSLGLSKVEPRPPCPPRTYQSLYRHFDNTLRAGTKRRGRPPKQRNEEVNNRLDATVESVSTPRLLSRTKPASNPASPEQPGLVISTPSKRAFTRSQGSSGQVTVVPPWIMPCIHRLCRTTGASNAPSHVYVGTSTALKVFAPLLSDPDMISSQASMHGRTRTLAIIVAIYLCVVFRMSGQRVTGQAFEDEARRALSALDEPDGVREDSMDFILKDVHAWMEHFEGKGFLFMEWLQNVPMGNVQEDNMEEKANGTYAKLGIRSFRDVADVGLGQMTLLPGLGTMMQEQLNFLNQAHRADYSAWKSGIVARIEALEATGPDALLRN